MPHTNASVTIDQVLDDFLAAQRARLSDTTYRRYADVVGLLRDSLNHYGYQALSEPEKRRWQKAYDAGQEDAFCALFGPERIAVELGSFLGWFMVRKVMAGQDLLRAAGTVTKKLARWLEEEGYVDGDAAADAVERGSEAARDLPAASRLTDALSELWRARSIDVEALPEEDWIEDSLEVTRVEPGGSGSARWARSSCRNARRAACRSDGRCGWSPRAWTAAGISWRTASCIPDSAMATGRERRCRRGSRSRPACRRG